MICFEDRALAAAPPDRKQTIHFHGDDLGEGVGRGVAGCRRAAQALRSREVSPRHHIIHQEAGRGLVAV
jgi:hypothetical protein